MSDTTPPTSLPYDTLTHNGHPQNGWVVEWNTPPRMPATLGNPIAVGRQGIGTVVIRDGLKCPGGRHFESIASIPFRFFKIVAGPKNTIEIHNTNPKGAKSWTVDLDKTCFVAVQFFDTGVIDVSKDPDYIFSGSRLI